MKKQTIRCPYCGSPAILRDASCVYVSNAFDGKVYVCSYYPACNSYVGVHQGTFLPKGFLAGSALRKKRIRAHRIFDQPWRQGIFSRQEAYRWLADRFCQQTRQAHIGNFSDYMCVQLIQEVSKVLENKHIPLSMAG